MRRLFLCCVLLVGGCTPHSPSDGDIAAVYDAFLGRVRETHPQRVLLQETTIPVTLEMTSVEAPGPVHEVSRRYSHAVREALADLVRRSATTHVLPPQASVTGTDVRIQADSAERILRTIREQELHRLSNRASVIQLSTVGFSRDGTVAVVFEQEVCGWTCGGGTLAVVRKHPGGWMAAEELVSVVF